MEKKYIVRLTDEERKHLREVIRKLSGTSQKVRRAYILLKADIDGPGWTDQKIANAFTCRISTVENIRRRLIERGFEETLNRKTRDQPARPKCLMENRRRKLSPCVLGWLPRAMRTGHFVCWLEKWWNSKLRSR